MNIANFTAHKVLVGNGSSADVLFMDILRKIKLEVTTIHPGSHTVCIQRDPSQARFEFVLGNDLNFSPENEIFHKTG